MKPRIFFIVLCILIYSSAGYAENYRYLRITGSERVSTKISVTNSPSGFVLVKENSQEFMRVECGKQGDTKRWEYRNAKMGVDLVGVRESNNIKLSGKRNGAAVNEVFEIDRAPWYQDVGFSLKSFVASSAKSVSFWMVHPKRLSAYRMKITREGDEQIAVEGSQYLTVKTKMIIDRFPLSAIWKAYHWHRKNDGLFLRYQGAGGRPGSPDTNVVITSGF